MTWKLLKHALDHRHACFTPPAPENDSKNLKQQTLVMKLRLGTLIHPQSPPFGNGTDVSRPTRSARDKKNAQTCANVTGPLACSLEKTPDAGACRQSMHREIKHSVNRSSTQAYREADLRKRRRFQVLVHHREEHIIQHLGSVVRAPMYLRQKQVSLSNRRWC